MPLTKSKTPKAKSPANNAKRPANKAKSPADKPKSPADKPKSPANNAKRPANKAKSPADKPKSPADKPKSPADKPKSPEAALAGYSQSPVRTRTAERTRTTARSTSRAETTTSGARNNYVRRKKADGTFGVHQVVNRTVGGGLVEQMEKYKTQSRLAKLTRKTVPFIPLVGQAYLGIRSLGDVNYENKLKNIWKNFYPNVPLPNDENVIWDDTADIRESLKDVMSMNTEDAQNPDTFGRNPAKFKCDSTCIFHIMADLLLEHSKILEDKLDPIIDFYKREVIHHDAA